METTLRGFVAGIFVVDFVTGAAHRRKPDGATFKVGLA
jgi:hypothetical protein